MSFGYSATDFVHLIEFSTRIYQAFKDVNDNSQSQVEALIKEFNNFHHCLEQLSKLAEEYNKELPFQYHDFQETLGRCWAALRPYKQHLVDSRGWSFQKVRYTIAYIGKEGEIDRLRRQIRGHYDSLHLWLSIWHAQITAEHVKQTERLLESPQFRSASRLSTGNTLHGEISDSELARILQRVNDLFEREEQRLSAETAPRRPSYHESSLTSGDASRRSSYQEAPLMPSKSRCSSRDIPLTTGSNAREVAELYTLKRALEDAFQERQQRQPTRVQRRATVDSVHSRTSDGDRDTLAESVETLRINRAHSTQATPISGQLYSPPSPLSEQIPFPSTPGEEELQTNPWREQPFSNNPGIALDFGTVDWNSSAGQRSSFATTPSTFSTASMMSSQGYSTARTTPEDKPVRRRLSSASLATLALGEGALSWTPLCRKVLVELETSNGPQSCKCDIQWRYNKDLGLSVRSVYRDGRTGNAQTWMTQDFPASGAKLPLTTAHYDGDISMEFPKRRFGKLRGDCTDIKYIFRDAASSKRFQTLLYTNGKNDAELLFDRPVTRIHSNLSSNECRGKNIRLWQRSEQHNTRNGLGTVDVLMVVFYTSALHEKEARWVEEPHHAFQWLEDSVYKKNTNKVKLTFSKDPSRWRPDKLFQQRRKSSNTSVAETPSPLSRSNTTALSLSAISPVQSRSQSRLSFLDTPPPRNDSNKYEYSKLEIEFQNVEDRNDFLAIWKEYVKPKPGYQGDE